MAKRLGRGYGSGKGGHTSGRGQKGQKSRTNINILFQGVKVKKSTLKRLPLRRGKGKFLSARKSIVVNLDVLNIFDNGAKIDVPALIKKGVVREKEAKLFGVKILGGGRLEKKIELCLPASKSAVLKIEKAGGKIVDTPKKA